MWDSLSLSTSPVNMGLIWKRFPRCGCPTSRCRTSPCVSSSVVPSVYVVKNVSPPGRYSTWPAMYRGCTSSSSKNCLNTTALLSSSSIVYRRLRVRTGGILLVPVFNKIGFCGKVHQPSPPTTDASTTRDLLQGDPGLQDYAHPDPGLRGYPCQGRPSHRLAGGSGPRAGEPSPPDVDIYIYTLSLVH